MNKKYRFMKIELEKEHEIKEITIKLEQELRRQHQKDLEAVINKYEDTVRNLSIANEKLMEKENFYESKVKSFRDEKQLITTQIAPIQQELEQWKQRYQ